MFDIEGFKTSQTLPLTLVLIIGMITGWLGYILFGDFAGNTNVVYVSAKEILKFEKERIRAVESLSIKGENRGKDGIDRHVFYGYSGEALKLMERLATVLSNKNTKVVFVSDGSVKGEAVSSVSKQIHARVLKVIKDKFVTGDEREELK